MINLRKRNQIKIFYFSILLSFNVLNDRDIYKKRRIKRANVYVLLFFLFFNRSLFLFYKVTLKINDIITGLLSLRR